MVKGLCNPGHNILHVSDAGELPAVDLDAETLKREHRVYNTAGKPAFAGRRGDHVVAWARKVRMASRRLFEAIKFGFAPENNLGFVNLDHIRLITSYVHSFGVHADKMFIRVWNETAMPMAETSEQPFEGYVQAAQSHNNGRDCILAADGTAAADDEHAEMLRPGDMASRPLTKAQVAHWDGKYRRGP